ncbi:MAG: hypothetical protein SGILL_003702 [Bacillariaceae sp.]
MENATPDQQLLFLCSTRPGNDLHLSLRSFYDRNTGGGGPTGLFIQLGGLTSEDVYALLQRLFYEAPGTPALHELAYIIVDKTQGNSFVVTHFIRQLELDGLIRYNKEAERWTWDIRQIQQHVGSSESVERVIVQYFEALDDYQRSLLITAASFGASHFELAVVLHAMDALADGEEGGTADEYKHDSPVRTMAQNIVALKVSIESGFVENVSPGVFKFSHDRIREAAYSLLPTGRERMQFHLKIGRHLQRWMDTEPEYGTSMTDSSIIMHAAKHLSLGADLLENTCERLDVAELNFTAAELAAKKAAFFPAMEYLRDGIRVLGPNAWAEHFEWCMRLHVALTRIEFNCGLLDQCNGTADTVIKNAKTFEQKKDVYNQKLLCLMQQERASEGVDLCLLILRGLGYSPPKRFFTLYVIRRYVKAESFLNKATDDDIRKLPELTDQNIEDQISILYRLGEWTFFGGPAIFYNLFAVDVICMIKEAGNHPLVTPMGLLVWGAIKFSESKFSECRRFASLAVEMAERLCTQHPLMLLRIKNLARFFSEAWYAPLQELVDPLLEDFQSVLALGGMEEYHLEGVNAPRFVFFCGRPLSTVRAECSKYMGVLRDYKRGFLWDICAPLAQAVANFMGESSSPSVLSGEFLDAGTLDRIENSAVETGRFQYQLYSTILAYHFGDLEGAESFIKAMRSDLYAEGIEPPGLSTRTFYTGLVYVALYRKTKRRKYKRQAIASYKLLAKWLQMGAGNCKYMKLILDAERASVQYAKYSPESVLTQFDEAIECASKMGVLHHEALACELASDFLARLSFVAEAKLLSYLKRSLACYEKWGGHAKVADLVSRYRRILGPS